MLQYISKKLVHQLYGEDITEEMVLALYGMERAVVSIGGKHHKYISVPRHPNSNNTVKDIKIYLKFCTVSVISYNY